MQAMSFVPFGLVEWQSQHEPTVEFSIADSSCQPASVRDVIGEADFAALLDVQLGYPPVVGTRRLRELIADWQGWGHADSVVVTVGAAEANTVVIDALVEPGDHVVVMDPGYRQIWGAAVNRGAEADSFPLDPDNGWAPDLDALAAVVRPGTKLIAITNPNNPVGRILTEPEMDAIVAIAARAGAWILADEVHRGTELHTDEPAPTFLGRYDRVVSVGSMSKAFGLPGLRIGWISGNDEIVTRAWRRHEYTTVTTSTLSVRLAETALAEPCRSRLLARNRGIIRAGFPRLAEWVATTGGVASIVPPDATALGFVRYHLDLTSLEMADALRTRAGVLVGAGAHFGAEGHFRVTHGLEAGYLSQALDRIGQVLKELSAER